MIVFLGPDGCGKSSVINALVRRPPDSFRSVILRHFRPGLILKRTISAPTTKPHAQPPRGTLLSSAKIIWFFFDYVIGGMVLSKAERANASLLVFDRYYHDLLVDPKRYRYGGPIWLARLVGKMIPEPDLWILLNAPAEVLQKRKQEVPPKETARQRQAYLELIKGFKNAVVIDASQPLDKVIGDVRGAIVDFMATETRERLGK